MLNKTVLLLLLSAAWASVVTKFSLYFTNIRVEYYQIPLLILVPLFAIKNKFWRLHSRELFLICWPPWIYVLVSGLSFVGIVNSGGEATSILFFGKGLAILVLNNLALTLIILYLGNQPKVVSTLMLRALVGAATASSLYGLASILLAFYFDFDLDGRLGEMLPFYQSGISVNDQRWGGAIRLNGLTNDPSVHAAFVGPVILYLLDRILKKMHWGLCIITIILLMSIVLTISGSGLIGFAVGVAFYAVVKCVLPGMGRIPFIKALSFFSLTVAAAIYGYSEYRDIVDNLIEVKFAGDGTILTHADIARRSILIFMDNPIFGVGLNNFSIEYQRYFGVSGYNSHNSWITYLVDTGVVGFLAMTTVLLFKGLFAVRFCEEWTVPISVLVMTATTSLGYEIYNLFFLQIIFVVLCFVYSDVAIRD